MSMGATVVTYTVDATNAEELHRRIRELLVPATRRAAGYRGFLLLDQGEGKHLAVVLFDSVELALKVQSVIGPVAGEFIYGLMSSPSVGSLCTVVMGDGVFGVPAAPGPMAPL